MTARGKLMPVLLVLFAPRIAAQGDAWEREVRLHLSQAARRLHDTGYDQVPESHVGALNSGESASFTLTLEGGATYVLTGVGDPDCDVFELALYSPNGYEVDAARSAGSAPIVQVAPREPGVYRIKVVMARCGTNPCRYGVAVLRKREVKDPRATPQSPRPPLGRGVAFVRRNGAPSPFLRYRAIVRASPRLTYP